MKMFGLSGAALALCAAAALAGPPAATKDSAPVDRVARTTAQPAVTTEFWLGIGCVAMPAALQAQLGLPEKHGLLVQVVVPDSPAEKAGIAPHDVLLRAGDKALDEPRDLAEVVGKVQQNKLTIELLRSGKTKTVEATPVKRPANARRRTPIEPAPGDREAMEKWLHEVWPSDGKRPPLSFRFVHPGAIIPRDALVAEPLPTNMTIIVSRSGSEPAKIVVTRDKEKWELTEKDLDKLPADIRPHVERMLGRGPFGVVGDLVPKLDPSDENPDANADSWSTPFPDQEKFPQWDSKLFERLEKRFDAMDRQMDSLQKQIENLGKQRETQSPVEK